MTNRTEPSHEDLSALIDGELTHAHAGPALALLQCAEGRAQWAIYHLIGDILRDPQSDALLQIDCTQRDRN